MTKRFTFFSAALMVAAASVLLFSALAGTGADAAKGGANGTTSAPTLTVSPNPVPNGTTSIVISGSGFRANQTLEVGYWGGIPSYTFTTNGNGSFSIVYEPAAGPFYGPSSATAFAAKFKGHTLVTLATAPFTVCATNPCP